VLAGNGLRCKFLAASGFRRQNSFILVLCISVFLVCFDLFMSPDRPQDCPRYLMACQAHVRPAPRLFPSGGSRAGGQYNEKYKDQSQAGAVYIGKKTVLHATSFGGAGYCNRSKSCYMRPFTNKKKWKKLDRLIASMLSDQYMAWEQNSCLLRIDSSSALMFF